MSEIIFAAVCASLLGVIVFQQITHTKERRELLNRIMAKDLPEYHRAMDKKPVGSGGNFLRKSIENTIQNQ